MDVETVRKTKQQNLQTLLNKPNVIAVGIGFKVTNGELTDELAVIVSVVEKLSVEALAPEAMVPQALGGVRTDVQALGVIKALQSPTSKIRPAPGGCSVGHVDVTAGTLGCLVYRGSDVFILSNNHVLANCNRGQRGDAILQPGKADGGTMNDQVAVLEDFVPIDFGGSQPQPPSSTPGGCSVAKTVSTGFNVVARALGSPSRIDATAVAPQTAGGNIVDCALARPLSPNLVQNRILSIGQPRGTATAALNSQVVKSGRSSGFTTGQIRQIDVTVQVEYEGIGTATFSGQLVATGMSQAGDSGSAVLDVNSRVVGLLFSGSDAASMINPIQNVMTALNITIPG
jgi:hypothetical protein